MRRMRRMRMWMQQRRKHSASNKTPSTQVLLHENQEEWQYYQDIFGYFTSACHGASNGSRRVQAGSKTTPHHTQFAKANDSSKE